MADTELIGGRHWKVPPVPVPSDDCVVNVGTTYVDDPENPGKQKIGNTGDPQHWHTGETVWILPVASTGKWLAAMEFMQVQDMDPNDPERPKIMQKRFHKQAESLAQYIAGWDWTDVAGDPLPQPYKNPDVILQLDNDEVSYLSGLVLNGPPQAEGEGSGASPDTSSTTAPPREKRSSAGSAKPSTATG